MDSKMARALAPSLNSVILRVEKKSIFDLLKQEKTELLAFNKDGKPVPADYVAIELALEELQNPQPQLIQHSKAANDKRTEEQKANELHDIANIILFARLAKKLILSQHFTQADARELDYLSAPSKPFQQTILSKEDLSIAWDTLKQQPELADKKEQIRNVAGLFDTYLGTKFVAEKFKASESAIDNSYLSLLDEVFLSACDLQNTNRTVDEKTIPAHYRSTVSEDRHRKLTTLRSNQDNEFKLHLYTFQQSITDNPKNNKQHRLNKIDAILTILKHPMLWRRLDKISGKSPQAQEYCVRLAREFKQLESSELLSQQEMVAILDKALHHNIVKLNINGMPGKSREWRAIELIRDRVYPPFRDKSLVIQSLQKAPAPAIELNLSAQEHADHKHSPVKKESPLPQSKPIAITIELAEANAKECEYKRKQLEGPDRQMANTYLLCATEYHDIVNILRFEQLAKQVIEADAKITENHLHAMDRMMSQLPSKEALPKLWLAITSHYTHDAKYTFALRKTALFFDSYFRTALQTIPIEAPIVTPQPTLVEQDAKHLSSTSIVLTRTRRPTNENYLSDKHHKIILLNDFFKVACIPPSDTYQRDRYDRLKEIRVQIDRQFKSEVAEIKDNAQKIRHLLQCLRYPALYLRRDGSKGKSATAHQYCRDITTILQTMERDIEQPRPGQDNQSRLDCLADFKTLLEEALSNLTLKMPLHGNTPNFRDSEKHTLIDTIYKKIHMKMVDLAEHHEKNTNQHLIVFRPIKVTTGSQPVIARYESLATKLKRRDSEEAKTDAGVARTFSYSE